MDTVFSKNPGSPATKAEWRRFLHEKRRNLTDSAYQKQSDVLVRHALNAELLMEAGTIHCFWPIVQNREPDLRPLLRSWLDQGKRLVLPVVHPTEEGHPRLAHRIMRSESDLVFNAWNIGEPVHGSEVPIDQFDVVLVPALGIDHQGNRLGYGKGFYDSFLIDVSCPTVGVVFKSGLISALPAEKHDIPLDAVLTEQGLSPLSNATRMTDGS